MAIIGCRAVAQPSAGHGVSILHHEPVQDLATAAPDGVATSRGPMTTTFTAMGRRFELMLEPNARVNRIASQLPQNNVAAAYQGQISGNGNSWVRLVLSPSGPAGLIWDGSTLYGIESPGDTATGTGQTTIFRLVDVYVPPGTMTCGADGREIATAFDVYSLIASEARTSGALSATVNLDIGLVADYEFSTDPEHAADPAAALITRINNVDGIFTEQVGIQFTPTEVTVFDSDTDPFTQSDASALLAELRDYRAATPAQNSAGLTHMFTGRALDGATVGIAYFSAVCSTSFGAGLSEGRRGPTFDSLIAAHEIGHNFGAFHDGDQDGTCPDTPTTFLMAPSLGSSGTDQFSQCSIEQMQAEIDAIVASPGSCLTEILLPDVALTTPTANPSELAGTTFDYVVTVTNRGAETATDTTVALNFGVGLNVESATPASGSCGAPATAFDCTLGDVPAGTSRDIVIGLSSTEVGDHSVSATATAAADAVPSNDNLTGTITIIPAVDLAATANSASVSPGESSVLLAEVRNISLLAATSVIVNLNFVGNIAVESVTLGEVVCAVTGGNAVECMLDELAPGSRVELRATIAGTLTGTYDAALTVEASEVDIAPDDNSVDFSITIRDAVAVDASSGGGGGGSAGILTCFALLSLLLFRARKGGLSYRLCL